MYEIPASKHRIGQACAVRHAGRRLRAAVPRAHSEWSRASAAPPHGRRSCADKTLFRPDRQATGHAGGAAVNGRPAETRRSERDPLAGLRAALRTSRPSADVELLRGAYDVAARCHQGQIRWSGDPYITHPVKVATILA